jgi:3-hydroxyisobutyrate dehydrogenase-like beta-hydroxyacid dehydrogenase
MTGSVDRFVVDHRGDARAVAVLGCGNMGSAIVRALLAANRQVVAWNRTLERAQGLAADGAEVVDSPAAAVAATPLAILCVGTTQDAREVLETAAAHGLTGVTVLNTTSGTPGDARELHDWAQAHGIAYVDAAIGAYPEQIGTESARLVVAGDEQLWETHRKAVLDLGGSSIFVGTDLGGANAIDAALTGAFYISSMVSFMEAARYMRSFGVSHEVLADLSSYSISVLDHQIGLVVDRLASGDYSTDQATLGVYADAASAFAATLDEDGAAPMVRTTAEVLRRAVAAGLGDQDLAAVSTLDP